VQSNRKLRLGRLDCSRPGLTRVVRGRGFSFQAPGGRPVTDEDEILRIKELAIPPAWTEVWICPDPLGHLQATGVDAAGAQHARAKKQR
jgi:DNA topoisomerase I